MTYQDNFPHPPEIMDQIAEQGLDTLPELIRTVVNMAMKVERQRYLKANPYQRSEDRHGHANGYKDKAVKTRLGEITFTTAVIDAAAGFAYFGTDDIPGRVVKAKLSDFTRVSALTLNAGEDMLTSAAKGRDPVVLVLPQG